MKNILTIIASCFFIFQVNAQYLKGLEGGPFSNEVLNSVLHTTNGDSTTLKQVLEKLKGNAVLINFWASWCKTCLNEKQYSYELEKDYANEKIKFLYLSTDKDYKQWLLALGKVNVGGNQYRIDLKSKNAIKTFLKIRGIPYYVLLYNDGNIYDAKASWPHLQKLRNEINLLLQIK